MTAYPAPTLIDASDPDLNVTVAAVGALLSLDSFGVNDRFIEDGTRHGIEHDNLKRAGWGAISLLAFSEASYEGDPEDCLEPLDQAFTDMLCDLMHLADSFGLSFSDLCDHANGHWQSELEGIV